MQTFPCPECQTRLMRTVTMSTGDTIECPKCRRRIVVPSYDGGVPLVLNAPASVGTGPAASPPIDDAARRAEVDALTGNYPVALAEWWGRAAAAYPAFVGPAVGFALLLLPLSAVGLVPCLGALFQFFVLVPLSLGPTVVALKHLRGRPWRFEDFFGGFARYGAVLGLGLLVGVATLLCALPLLVAVYAGLVTAPNPRAPDPAWIQGFALFGAVPSLVLFVLFAFRLVAFSPQLVFDRGFGPLDALRGSWRLTRGRLLPLVGVLIVLTLLVVAAEAAVIVPAWLLFPQLGQLGLYGYSLVGSLGALFVTPQVTLTWTAGYLRAAEAAPAEPAPAEAETPPGGA